MEAGPSKDLGGAVRQGVAQDGALGSSKLPVGFQPPCEGQLVMTDTVSLQSALRYLSVRSRLNLVSECPVLRAMQAEELRWAAALCKGASAIS